MTHKLILDKGWQLYCPARSGEIPTQAIYDINPENDAGSAWLDIDHMPSGVHEILHSHKLINDDFLIGEGAELKWVAENDWKYRLAFHADDSAKKPGDSYKAYLCFDKLDTVVTISLNGDEIAQWQDLYLPLRVDVTGKLKETNVLELTFRSPYAYMNEHPLPDEWKGKMPKWKVLRKPIHDFDNYLGAQPYLTLIGVFGDVALEIAVRSEFTHTEVDTLLSNGYHTGAVVTGMSVSNPDGCCVNVKIIDPDGYNICEERILFDDGKNTAKRSLLVEHPKLWWPRGYGDQPLYTVHMELLDKGGARRLDYKEYVIGFREAVTDINFNLKINNVKIRMWGANLSPLDGRTHRWNSERAKNLLDLFTGANMNTMRIWGEGEPYDDELYAECDKRGILVWQEFFGSYGMLPDWPEYQKLCEKEAGNMIMRLKHHPCIFMWCGGNEVVMGGEYDHPGERVIGLELYTKIYPAICAKLDPSRYYHITSPCGGDFANDPREGDSHGYEMWWYVPGMEYPVAFTEHMRVSGPALKSVRRWIGEDKLWDDGFVDAVYPKKRQRDLMPEAWFHRVGNSLDTKAGPVHEFRDADSPEELAYKYAAAHAKSFKNGIKRSRMGRPSHSDKPRISNMHLIWKLADTFPLIYSAIIDYYGEPYIPYYEAKRSYEPVMCCFDIRDTITLWLVNDSMRDVSGTLEFGLFTPRTNSFLVKREVNACMGAGCSGEITTLDEFGQFRSENVLYARFIDSRNGVDNLNFDYVDIERRLIFPEAKLEIAEGAAGSLLIRTDSFARCVELSAVQSDARGDTRSDTNCDCRRGVSRDNRGGSDGDDSDGDDSAFGYYFSDNYFDLIPGLTKEIRIGGARKNGLVSAKAHYSPHISTLNWSIP